MDATGGTAVLDLRDADGEQLEILIPEAAKRPEILEIPYELIEPDPAQPRKTADDELRASIAREGLLQDITVRQHPEKMGHYMLVDGERRWRSAAGILSTMRAKLREDLSASKTSRLAVQLIANSAKGLSPLEEAETYQRMLVENPEWTVSDLAKHIGKPRSTVAQRLEAMELGAWLEDVATGAISWTMLVEMLLPYRGCPDAVHVKARERAKKAGWWRGGESPAIGPRDFERAVRDAYKPALYPLNKSKTNYGINGDRPIFNTKHHDAECNCGGMLFSEYDGATPRKFCGNPSWWGPLHRKALKDKPKTSSSSAGESRQRASRKELRLPKGATEVTGSVHEAPPEGCAWVTDVGGTSWSLKAADGPAFDPIVLQKLLKPVDLVLVRGTDAVRVATTNRTAMQKAQAAFSKQVEAELAKDLKPLRTALRRHTSTTGISGIGVQALLSAMFRYFEDSWELNRTLRALCAAEGITLPPDSDDHDTDAACVWARELSAKDAKALLTALAALGAAELPFNALPGDVGDEKARRVAAGRKVPWLKDVADKKGTTKPSASADGDEPDEPDEVEDDDFEADED